MRKTKVLFTSVFGPFGVKDDWSEGLGMQMELLNNQVTRQQGVHSPRQSYLTFALYLLAENISVPSTVLDFPLWKDFVDKNNLKDWENVTYKDGDTKTQENLDAFSNPKYYILDKEGKIILKTYGYSFVRSQLLK